MPEGVQAFFILQAANVSEENEKLARTTCGEMTYNNMKEALRKIFGDTSNKDNASPPVKSEPESVNYNYRRNVRGRGNYRGGSSSRGSYSRGSYGRNSSNRNPTDRYGKTLQCFKCSSYSHLANECSIKNFRNQRNSEANMVCDTSDTSDIHITLLNLAENDNESVDKSDLKRMSLLVRETVGRAVLDSACTSTICGELWLETYLEMLTQEERKLVKYSTSTKSYCFGDGRAVKAKKKVTFPALIGPVKVNIESDVVCNDLPLLLSHKSMKAAGMILDFNSDQVCFQGNWIPLKTTTSGHYSVKLSRMILDDNTLSKVVLHVKTLDKCSYNEKKNKAIKLHKQFAHASKEKLMNLVKKTKSFNDKEFIQLIEIVCDECVTCRKFKKPSLRPVVGMPLGDRFNHTVCMDLKEYEHNKSWIFHLIDSTTRYSQARLIHTKNKEVIIRNIYLMWISVFGAPVRFLSDNGGEFSNDHYRQMNEKLGIETCTTAAESPFSNGVCERHNAVIAEAMKKTIEEEKCDPEIALAWAISAKNALHNNSGYSPNELIFGYNVNSPSVLTDKLPALEPHTTSDMVRIMQNARHTAMKNHIEVDASDKIRKALRAKTRTYADEYYEPGEKIYYQRPSDRGKRGPATVLGVDGQLVLVRHGGQFMRIHPCQLQKVKLSTKPESKPEVNMEKIETQPKNKVIEKNDIDDESEINIREEFVNEENENEVAIPNIEKQTNVKLKNGNEKPKRKMEVEFKIEGEAKWRTAKVIQAQPKAGGKYKNWVNVEEKDGKQVCIRWSDLEKWKEIVNEQSTEKDTDDTNENFDGSSEESVEEVVLFTDNREKSKEVAALQQLRKKS